MKEQRKLPGYSRTLLLIVALLLPTVSLIPLGGLWLWQHGYVVYWGVATCIVVTGLYYLEKRLITGPAPTTPRPEESTDAVSDAAWSPLQSAAWDDVMALASTANAERLSSRDAALNLGLETIETVARRLHPERKDPLLQFTVPEALAVVERASNGLRDFVTKTFPLGDRITVAQLMWVYRWRGALNLVEKGHDLWRIMRLLNPVSAATQELRERFTRQIYDAGREHLARRLARAYVKEVGRAAIDLYGGSLRVTSAELNNHITTSSRADMAAAEARGAEPIRILLAGQTGAGKSSLLNALANAVEAEVSVVPTTARVTAYKLMHEGLPAALLIDTPGLTGAALLRRLDRKRRAGRHGALGRFGYPRGARDRPPGPGRHSQPFLRRAKPAQAADAARAHAHRRLAALQRMGAAVRPVSRCAAQVAVDPRRHGGSLLRSRLRCQRDRAGAR